jgi:hypothetical protein
MSSASACSSQRGVFVDRLGELGDALVLRTAARWCGRPAREQARDDAAVADHVDASLEASNLRVAAGKRKLVRRSNWTVLGPGNQREISRRVPTGSPQNGLKGQ